MAITSSWTAMSYNFAAQTRGNHRLRDQRHPGLPQDQFYIKRMVALGGETGAIGNDRHLIINGQAPGRFHTAFRKGL